MDEALRRIEGFVDEGSPHLVATINPEFVMRANEDKEFARVLESADLCLPDGTGVVWAARRQGCSMLGPVAGTDMLPLVAAMCARRGFPLFLLGAAPGVADELASQLRSAHPGLEVAAHSGGPDQSQDAETLRLIHENNTQVLLVAFGHPKQELWIDRLKNRLGVAVAIGMGGAFDYLTGRVPRAPVWMRNAGLEWSYRLVKQPWRIQRMSVLPRYAIKVFLSSK
jgi:N-acetylglucosaminyldiphosphoundecaprenol N-acetyl-beta-D-mannosaminyltransferase